MESVLDRVIKQNTENVNLLKTKDYNIFSVLQIQSKEVLICRMIADLLNPRGQHGAGAVSYTHLVHYNDGHVGA